MPRKFKYKQSQIATIGRVLIDRTAIMSKAHDEIIQAEAVLKKAQLEYRDAFDRVKEQAHDLERAKAGEKTVFSYGFRPTEI